MLALTGRTADGWIPSQAYGPPERLPELSARIDAAAAESGRHPSAVRRLYNVDGTFGSGAGFLEGTTDDWVEQLSGLALDVGISGFILSADGGSTRVMQRFAEDVAPAVHDVVDHARTSGRATAAPPVPAEQSGPPRIVVGDPAPPEGLGVTPTPDDGRRRSDQRVWDESTRPVLPPLDGRLTYTTTGRADGQHLVDIHDQLRSELT